MMMVIIIIKTFSLKIITTMMIIMILMLILIGMLILILILILTLILILIAELHARREAPRVGGGP